MMDKYQALIERVMQETRCVSTAQDAELEAFATELASTHLTAERDAEIASLLPVPYTKTVPARAQIDGETLLVPRMVLATASRPEGGEWSTSSKGPRMKREKAGCVAGVYEDLIIPGVVEIIRIAILWRREK